jgi:hypothetical protein
MITNYENPLGTIALLDSSDQNSDAKLVFVSTDNGKSSGVANKNAITTIALCNTGAPDPDLTDETVNQVIVSIYLVKATKSYGAGNRIVSNLIIPAGETVFFNDERIILDEDDEIWVGSSDPSLLSVTISSLEV